MVLVCSMIDRTRHPGYMGNNKLRLAVKRLTDVETDPDKSHQHEIQGVRSLRELLGEPEKKTFINAELYYLSDNEEPYQEELTLTWYNARAGKPRSPEYRLYYPGDSEVMARARSGDLLAVGVKKLKSKEGIGEDVYVTLFVIESGSHYEKRILTYMSEEEKDKLYSAKQRDVFVNIDYSDLTLAHLIGEEDTVKLAPDHELSEIQEIVMDVCREIIPSPTKDLSEKSDFKKLPKRSDFIPPLNELFEKCWEAVSKKFNICKDPDRFVVMCYSVCEKVYYALEYKYIEKMIEIDVKTPEEFIDFAHSVLNARKSRAGRVLERIIEHLFQRYKIEYERNPRLPSGSSPDFVVPNTTEPCSVLSVKTTLKERWRQIVQEAGSLPDVEHFLITLERAPSKRLFSTIREAKVKLVVPEEFHNVWSPDQPLTIKELLDILRQKKEHKMGTDSV